MRLIYCREALQALNEPAYLPGIIEQAAQWRSESLSNWFTHPVQMRVSSFFKEDTLFITHSTAELQHISS